MLNDVFGIMWSIIKNRDKVKTRGPELNEDEVVRYDNHDGGAVAPRMGVTAFFQQSKFEQYVSVPNEVRSTSTNERFSRQHVLQLFSERTVMHIVDRKDRNHNRWKNAANVNIDLWRLKRITRGNNGIDEYGLACGLVKKNEEDNSYELVAISPKGGHGGRRGYGR